MSTAQSEHQEVGGNAPSPIIATAAAWLADHWHVAPQPVTRYLRESYGLGFNDAVKAIAEAKRIIQRTGRAE